MLKPHLNYFLILTLIILAPNARAQDVAKKQIAVVCQGAEKYLQLTHDRIQKELELLAEDHFDLKWIGGDCAPMNPEQALSDINNYLRDKTTDLIIAQGASVAQVVSKMARTESFSKPVMFADYLDADLIGFPYDRSKNVSGVQNFYYVAKKETVDKELKDFKRIVPFKKVHALVQKRYQSLADPALKKISKKIDFPLEIIYVEGNAKQIFQKIDQKQIEALYLPPLDLSDEEYAKLITGMIERKIPSFAMMGYGEVEKGILAARVPKFYTKFARRIALNADRILKGEKAGALPVSFRLENKFIINKRTASLIGVSIPFDILLDAEVLFPNFVQGEHLNLFAAVTEALQSNYNFKIADEQIKAASKDHLLQWANYLPSVNFQMNYDVNDTERAANSGGSVPKESFGYAFTLNQLIFSDPVIRNIVNAKKQVRVEKLTKKTTELEISDQAIGAYLNYLRTKALYRVQQELLKSTAENLSTARKLYKAGSGPREDVLRWESNVATEKSNTLRDEQDVRQARVVLNQLMNTNLEKVFKEEDIGLETMTNYLGGKTHEPYIMNVEIFRMVMDFSIEYAIKTSPEIKALDIGIEQQKQTLAGARGKFYLPEANLAGDVGDDFKQKFENTVPEDEHADWNVGIELTYPLFDGGRRPVDYLKQRNLLKQLEFKRLLKVQEIERDLRNAGYEMLHSYPSVELTREAMVKSTENYEIWQKKYDEGLATISDLIDSLSDKYSSEGDAVIAVYDFLEDLSGYDRQLGTFFMVASDEAKVNWHNKVKEYLETKGVVF